MAIGMPLKETLRVPTKLEIGELRRLKNPPVSVRRCLEMAVLVINAEKYEAILLNGRSIRVHWERDVLRTLVDFETFISAMTDVKKTTDSILAAPALRRYVALTYLDGPEPLTHAKVQRSSGPAGVVLRWLSECLSQAAAQDAARSAAGTSAKKDLIQGKAQELAADMETLASPQTAIGGPNRVAKGVDKKRERNLGAAKAASSPSTKSSAVREAADDKQDTAATVASTAASDEASTPPRKAPLKASLVMSAPIEVYQEAPRDAGQLRSSAIYEEKLEPEAPTRRAPVKQRSLTAAAAQRLLRDAEDREVKEEERELASRGMADVPPPGSPPKHKIVTVGALLELLPKHQTADPQQRLMMALSAPVAGRKTAEKDTAPCDKCDGKHATDDCPHYPKAREKHADAWSRHGSKNKSGQGDGANGSAFVLRGARVVPQPGDGSCMFHSLAYCIGGNTCATTLRKDIAQYIADHPDMCIGGTPIQDWVLWDSGLSIKDYTARMATGNHWGGAIELAVCVLVRNVLVHIYESAEKRGEYARISTFGDSAGSTSSGASINEHGGAPDQKLVHILYSGRVHYDALVKDRY